MGRPVGSIVQLGIETVCNGQRMLNVLHYRVETESGEADVQAEQENFLAQVNSVNGIIDDMKACLSNDVTVVQAVAQFIRAERWARSVLDIGEQGDSLLPCEAQNVAAVITKRTAFAGRWAIGSFHLGGLPSSAYVAGNLDPTFKLDMEVLALQLLEPIVVPIVGGTYVPVLVHPLGEHGGSTELASTEVQDTLRVMRRRTVGLGI